MEKRRGGRATTHLRLDRRVPKLLDAVVLLEGLRRLVDQSVEDCAQPLGSACPLDRRKRTSGTLSETVDAPSLLSIALSNAIR